jgi:hypothetical protein
MSRRLLLCSTILSLAATSAPAHGPDPAPDSRRPIDLVICLDTSGSMTQLIDSARAKLWDIVNELAKAQPTPELRVGLLTYGTPENSSAAAGWVVRQTDLTGDLDTVYSKMMGMRTSGGDEFVGWVLNDALKTMSWSSDPAALKLIFVAGNESADQAADTFNFRVICDQARSKGITINSIFAGGRDQGVSEKWEELGRHGGGVYQHIDMEKGTVQIATPQDMVLQKLNVQLNATYLPYGKHGATGCANQWAQDGNAQSMGAQSEASRVAAKATALYGNAFWDLVDACREKQVNLSELKDEDLPENMRKMTPGERQAYVDGMATTRAAVQKEIADANIARQKYIEAELKKRGESTSSLDEALLKALREQAAKMGFKFEGC